MLNTGQLSFQGNPGIASWNSVVQKAARTRIRLLHEHPYRESQIDHDYSNLSVSIDWLAEQNDQASAELLLAYIDTLSPYLRARGHNHELEGWCQAGLRACQTLQINPTRVQLALGEAQYALGHWEQASATFQAAANESLEDQQGSYPQALFAAGRTQLNQGRFETALVTLNQADKLFSANGDTDGIVGARSEIAAYYLNRRDLNKALTLYLEINELQKQAGYPQAIDSTLLMLGVVYRHMKKYDQAITYLSELYERGESNGAPASIATAAHHLAWAYLELGQMGYARRLCGQAIALYEEIRDNRGLSDGYEQLGAILIEEKKPDEALAFIEKSIDIRQKIGNQPGTVSSLRRLALAHLMLTNYKKMFSLVLTILSSYIQMKMLSRQRVAALARDFVLGIWKASAYQLASNADGQPAGSVMEKIVSSLVSPRKQ